MSEKLTQNRLRTSSITLLALPPLAFLHVYPWIPGRPDPLVFGVFPMSLFLWIIWTALLIALTIYITFIRDPLAYVADRVGHSTISDVDDGST